MLPPVGYLVEVYGPWPEGGVWVIKMFSVPNWKSSRNFANYHTVTIVLAVRYNPQLNPLMMDPELSQLLDWHCTCKSGLRTAASCTHRLTCLMLLCYAEGIDSAKVQEALVVDTAR